MRSADSTAAEPNVLFDFRYLFIAIRKREFERETRDSRIFLCFLRAL